MKVENTINQGVTSDQLHHTRIQDTTHNSNSLTQQTNFNQHLSQKIDTLSTNQSSFLTKTDSDSIKLGALSSDQTTVAQLLLTNPELKSKTWSIIHNPINKDKAFHQISAGKDIFYNPKTQELSWSEPSTKNSTMASNNTLVDKVSSTAPIIFQTPLSTEKKKVVLGQINQDNPTISNLLSHQSEFKAQRWDIIHSNLNKNKTFTNIPNNI